jgi:hypothetical protein
MRGWIALTAALAACGGDSGQVPLHLSWRTEGSMPCPAATCRSMELLCDATVSVRIIDAADPSRIYVDRCLPLDAADDLCGLSALPLGGEEVPNTAVRVQVSIWPRAAVGDQCPAQVSYDLQGLPQLLGNVPAIGGEQLVRLGDDDIDVALACPNIDALASDACLAGRPVKIGAGVDDFAQGRSVDQATADYLILSAGEPMERLTEDGGTEWELRPTALSQLVPEAGGRGDPAWTGALDPAVEDVLCLEVLHRTEGTPTATCRSMPSAVRSVELDGGYVPPALRDRVLTAIGLSALPPDGLVVGRVVDRNGAPVPGMSVLASPPASAVYISGDGARIEADLDETSTSGLFVSTDAAFGTLWSVYGNSPAPVPASRPAIGGRIRGHLTVVELVLGEPSSQE